MLELLFSWVFISASMIFKTENPLFFSFFLVLYSLISSLTLTWFSMSWLFLTISIMFLGGMMVIYSYAASMSASSKTLVKPLSFNKVTLYLLILLSLKSSLSYKMVYDFKGMADLYSMLNSCLLMFMASYLLLTLLILMKVIRASDGPLKN